MHDFIVEIRMLDFSFGKMILQDIREVGLMPRMIGLGASPWN